LTVSPEGLAAFSADPAGFLVDVVRSLDPESRAALGVIFMNGGRLASPVTLDARARVALEMMGGASQG
jgi:hypothetical protein